MTLNQPQPDQQPDFRAILTPNRSLSATGFLVLMSAIGIVSFAIGIAFLSMGAWPVTGFFGLDVLLVYYAFRANYKSGRAYETVEINPSRVLLTRVDADGKSEQIDLNTYWARVQLEEEAGGRANLSLVSHGRSVPLAAFLSDDERREFATVLDRELRLRRSFHAPST
ncbi:MAG: DUF2244 domain-containing protein [Hyphomicrobiaceae bacterium]|nr:DUF2244 domain-containing protein [Hyphomicrobiaceae bacterium]